MSPKPVFLDVDSSIVEKNLRITEDPNEEFNKLFESEQYPSKVVKPFPGFCIKTKEVGTDTKVFVNICQTDVIPSPKDITEEDLVELCNTDDSSEFRIPMSIGDIRTEFDKKGGDAKAVDIAINPEFYIKVENSSLFKSFFMAVVFEGLRDKHQLHATDDRIMLKNKKAYGTLQMHRIRQKEVEEKMGTYGTTELTLNENTAKPKIETLSSVTFDEEVKQNMQYRLFKRKTNQNVLVGEFKMPNICNSKELTLDIGEDRIILESNQKNYFLDIFLPYDIIQADVVSTFNKTSKILTITMPIKEES